VCDGLGFGLLVMKEFRRVGLLVMKEFWRVWRGCVGLREKIL
jgi:hypothetical protein